MTRSRSLAEWHIDKHCAPEFFRTLEEACGIALSPDWRREFQSELVYLARMTDTSGLWGLDKEYAEFVETTTRDGAAQFLISIYNLVGGVARGSWGASGKLDGPFYRFVRAAYLAIPPRLRAKSPDALCRRCKLVLRARASISNQYLP